MKTLRRLLGRIVPNRPVKITAPPLREPDPELVSHAIQTARVLSKADRSLEWRRRINLELTHAEDVIRRHS